MYMNNTNLISNMDGGNPKIYTDNAMNRKLGRVGKPIVRRNSKTQNKKTIKKECPKGKVLSPKGRCVKDRSKLKPIKKECPEGKVLSPKGRCIKDRSKLKSIKKECPEGKILSPKGRCVKDRTNVKPVKRGNRVPCVNHLSLKLGNYDNYTLNGTYAKCLEFSKSTKKWQESNKKLGFRSEYITPEQMKKHEKNYGKYSEQIILDNKKNLAQWRKNNPRKNVYEWNNQIYGLPKEIYILNQSALESETICKNEGNLSFQEKEIPRSNNKIMTEQLCKESCVYCKVGEPNKVIFRKLDRKWYIQDLHKSIKCTRTGINGPDFYKPHDVGTPKDVLFYTKEMNHVNPPENNSGSKGFISNSVDCLKEPTKLRNKLNLIWDKYDKGKLDRKQYREHIQNTWTSWVNKPFNQKDFEIKHKKGKKTLTWSPSVVSPPESRVRLHKRARKLSDNELS